MIDHRWIEFSKGKTKFEVPITGEMAPNVYACLTLIQPHNGKPNDRPIRLYGIVPLKVTNLETVLAPEIEAPEEWRPQKNVSVKIKEAQGRAMTYTLAVVDEGLLGLTNHLTPDLHDYFYRKEALGVRTWDLYDVVVDAYGATLERLLAIGGSDALDNREKKQEERRFPRWCDLWVPSGWPGAKPKHRPSTFPVCGAGASHGGGGGKRGLWEKGERGIRPGTHFCSIHSTARRWSGRRDVFAGFGVRHGQDGYECRRFVGDRRPFASSAPTKPRLLFRAPEMVWFS